MLRTRPLVALVAPGHRARPVPASDPDALGQARDVTSAERRRRRAAGVLTLTAWPDRGAVGGSRGPYLSVLHVDGRRQRELGRGQRVHAGRRRGSWPAAESWSCRSLSPARLRAAVIPEHLAEVPGLAASSACSPRMIDRTPSLALLPERGGAPAAGPAGPGHVELAAAASRPRTCCRPRFPSRTTSRPSPTQDRARPAEGCDVATWREASDARRSMECAAAGHFGGETTVRPGRSAFGPPRTRRVNAGPRTPPPVRSRHD